MRSPELKTHLMTGEFVRIEKCKGQSFLFRIVDVLDYRDLAAAEQAASLEIRYPIRTTRTMSRL